MMRAETSEAQRKRAKQAIPERRMWLPVAGMFVLLCILVWLNEILDLPSLLLGTPHTPINWREAMIETVLIASLGLFAVLRLIRGITERKRAEEALREYRDHLEELVKERTAELIKINEQLQREITERKRAEEALQVSHHFLEIANRHTEMSPLLKEFVAEIQNFTGCAAVGLRMLDEEGNIPYETYVGFSQRFYESESPLSIKSDQCMCINVIKGVTDPKLSFYTKGGSFFMNGTTRFLATVSEEEKGRTRNVCNQFGYESVVLIPIRVGERILGLIHAADPQENMVPVEMVEVLEGAAMQLGTAIQRVLVEEELTYMATHDALTRLPNRVLFNDRLTLALAHAHRRRQKLAVMLLDLDQFKDVNDTLGHSVGDKLLQAVGSRLTSLLRKSDTAARMGGDEFMLILPEIARWEDATKIAQKILGAIRKPFEFDGHKIHITTSIGIATYPTDGKDTETLMRSADIAMYRAKEQGRDNYQRYTSAPE